MKIQLRKVINIEQHTLRWSYTKFFDLSILKDHYNITDFIIDVVMVSWKRLSIE